MSRGTQRHLLWQNAAQQRFFKPPERTFLNFFTYAKRVDIALSALFILGITTRHLAITANWALAIWTEEKPNTTPLNAALPYQEQVFHQKE
ncbi:MAG: hypothetical protein ACFN4S_03970 [Prevotella conceptionensis]|jgi:hypothetical protein|uniref:hypothetical protein n=1 Tax=Prevotella conceptionensis TaxID=340486 RepID=UPI0002F22A96|nr:hypothetical protein [Prevotella conceptionensis]